MIPPMKILEFEKIEYTGSEEDVEGSLIEPKKEVNSMYPITIKGRNLPHPVVLGLLLGI